MSKGISNTLNMRSLEEIMAETEAEEEVEQKEELPVVTPTATELINSQQMRGVDHAKKMDELYIETIDVARKIVDMGMNIEPSKAPRMFEVANQLFKTAQDSAISKRDAELKLMKLIHDQEKIDIDKRRLMHELGEKGEITGEVIMVEDRNKLLRMLREQNKAVPAPPATDDPE